MRLSEAIRLGGMLAPKCQGDFYDEATGGMCVQGAALNAVGRLDTSGGRMNHRAIQEIWPQYEATSTSPEDVKGLPEVCDGFSTVLDVAVDLNNFTDMTRETIADWVATMEDKYKLVEQETPTEEQETPQPQEVA